MASTSSQVNNDVQMAKIYICPAKKSWDRVIRQHFGQFGKVEFIEYHMKKTFGFAFVQFNNAKSASAAIAEAKHKINGKIVKAKVAYSQQQTPSVSGHSKRPKANAASPINILNEDCLREIFKRLHIVDLLSTADVCHQFRNVAKDLIKPVEYLHLEMNSNISLPLLRLFGPEIESIKLDFGLFSNYGINLVLDRIATIGLYPDSKLTKISITDWKIKGKFINRLKPIFSRITSLSIYEAAKNDETVAELLNVCTELKELELMYIYFGEISKIEFPKLETLIVDETPKLRDHMMDQFLSSNPQLKTLSMDWNTKLTSKAVRNLNPNIEKLELCGEITLSRNLDEFNRLKILKSLGLNCCFISGDEVVNSLAKKELPIEELYLIGVDLDRAIIDGIKCLKKSLKKIKLTSGDMHDNGLLVEMVKAHPQLKSITLAYLGEVIGIETIKEIIKSAPELEHFENDEEDFMVIGPKDFESILKLVQSRPNKNKLKIVLSGQGCKLKVPEILQKQSREWLEIEVSGWGCTGSDDSDYTEYDSDIYDHYEYDHDLYYYY